jgi:hypothetical protein
MDSALAFLPLTFSKSSPLYHQSPHPNPPPPSTPLLRRNPSSLNPRILPPILRRAKRQRLCPARTTYGERWGGTNVFDGEVVESGGQVHREYEPAEYYACSRAEADGEVVGGKEVEMIILEQLCRKH